MSGELIAGAVTLAAVVILAGIGWAARRRQPKVGRAAYRAKPLMTDNEREFHGRIRRAVPELDVYPQVPILALLEPNAARNSPAFRDQFREISNRRVDWLIDASGASMIIELDDKTHDPAADRRRDAVLGQCGYRVLRYESRRKPTVERIRTDVMEALRTR